MNRIYNSPAAASVHETMRDLYEIGLVDDKTMKRYDEMCLAPVKPLSPKQIRTIRTRQQVTQKVLSHYLNVTPGLISQWERGEKKPSGTALKLLTLVSKKGLQALV